MERFLLPLAVCGLTIIVDPALAKGAHCIYFHPNYRQLPVLEFQHRTCRRQAISCPVAVAGATAMLLREDAEVQPMSAIKS